MEIIASGIVGFLIAWALRGNQVSYHVQRYHLLAPRIKEQAAIIGILQERLKMSDLELYEIECDAEIRK